MGFNSKSVFKIVDLLCEGPIEGIQGGKKGVFLDETALKSSDGTDLVSPDDVSFDARIGSRGQSYLPQAKGRTSNIQSVAKEIGSGYEEKLDKDGSRVKSRNYGAGQQVFKVTDPEVDSIDLIFTVPRLFSTAQEGLVKGQLFDAQIFFDVAIQDEGSGSAFKRLKTTDPAQLSSAFKTFSDSDVFYIDGISTSNFQLKISGIELSGVGPWNIKVRKYPNRPGRTYSGDISHSRSDAAAIDEDIFRATFGEFQEVDKQLPLKSGRSNTFIWTAVQENFRLRTAYPHSACVGLDISTEEFPQLPTRAYLVRGRKVRIPHNAVPREDGSLEFIGSFNGSLGDFTYTTCPVCIFYDLLTNDRYGAGHFVKAENLSWVDLYPLAQYSNQLVNGEPRFACNVEISSQADAYSVLRDFAGIFRGMMYWQSNVIQLTADHGNLDGSDVDPVHIFSNSSVIDGVFGYSHTSLKTRSTSIRVRYIDPDSSYKPNVLVIEDADLISKYGYQIKDVVAFGCTSKTQARRMGRWMMKAEELDANTVVFSVGLEGALVFPGQVFAIQDELRANARLSGRVRSSTTTTIVADQLVTLPEGDPTLTCVLNDGTVESRPITDVVNSTITVGTAFTSAPLVNAIYSIKTSTVVEQKFRCLSVQDSGDGTFAVTGVEFNDSIYSAAEAVHSGELEFEPITAVFPAPPTPII